MVSGLNHKTVANKTSEMAVSLAKDIDSTLRELSGIQPDVNTYRSKLEAIIKDAINLSRVLTAHPAAYRAVKFSPQHVQTLSLQPCTDEPSER